MLRKVTSALRKVTPSPRGYDRGLPEGLGKTQADQMMPEARLAQLPLPRIKRRRDSAHGCFKIFSHLKRPLGLLLRPVVAEAAIETEELMLAVVVAEVVAQAASS